MNNEDIWYQPASGGAPINLSKHISKREYFAAMAMQGMAASDVIQGYLKDMFINGTHSANQGTKDLAKSAVNLADALLAELEKEG